MNQVILMEQKMMTCETKTMKKTLLVDTKVLAVPSELCDVLATFNYNCTLTP